MYTKNYIESDNISRKYLETDYLSEETHTHIAGYNIWCIGIKKLIILFLYLNGICYSQDITLRQRHLVSVGGMNITRAHTLIHPIRVLFRQWVSRVFRVD